MKLTETQKNFRKQMQEINGGSKATGRSKYTIKSKPKVAPFILVCLVLMGLAFAYSPEASATNLKSLFSLDTIKSMSFSSLWTSNDFVKKNVADYLEEMKMYNSQYEGVMSDAPDMDSLDSLSDDYYEIMQFKISEIQRIKRIIITDIEIPNVMTGYHNLLIKELDDTEIHFANLMNTPSSDQDINKYYETLDLSFSNLDDTSNAIMPELIRVFEEIGMKYEEYDGYIRYYYQETNPMI